MRTPFDSIALAFVSCLMISCSMQQSTKPLAEQPRFELIVTKNNELRRFDLLLRPAESRDLCLNVDQWPSRNGVLDGGSQLAYVTTDSGRIPAKDGNFGYCPGGCGYFKVAVGDSLSGFISFDQFPGFDELVSSDPSILHYTINPVACRNDMRIVKRG